MTRQVQVLEDGLVLEDSVIPHRVGDIVVLTDDQYARIPANAFDSIVKNVAAAGAGQFRTSHGDTTAEDGDFLLADCSEGALVDIAPKDVQTDVSSNGNMTRQIYTEDNHGGAPVVSVAATLNPSGAMVMGEGQGNLGDTGTQTVQGAEAQVGIHATHSGTSMIGVWDNGNSTGLAVIQASWQIQTTANEALPSVVGTPDSDHIDLGSVTGPHVAVVGAYCATGTPTPSDTGGHTWHPLGDPVVIRGTKTLVAYYAEVEDVADLVVHFDKTVTAVGVLAAITKRQAVVTLPPADGHRVTVVNTDENGGTLVFEVDGDDLVYGQSVPYVLSSGNGVQLLGVGSVWVPISQSLGLW